MSQVIGTTVAFAVPDSVKNASLSIIAEGELQDFSLAGDGDRELIKDHKGRVVGFADSAETKGFELTVLVPDSVTMPPRGAEIIGLSALPEIGAGGRAFVDKPTTKWSNKGWKEISVKGTHFPDIS